MKIPQNNELEMQLLGAILVAPDSAYPLVAETVTQQMFWLDTHRLIYRIAGELYQRGIMPDVSAVRDEFKARDLMHKIANGETLIDCMNWAVGIGPVDDLARKLADKAVLREIMRGCLTIADECQRQELSPDAVMDNWEASINRVRAYLPTATGVVAYEQAAAEAIADLESRYSGDSRTVTTGVGWLDNLTDGWQAGDLWVWAARPNTGKSRVLLSKLLAGVVSGNTAGFISLDMARTRLMRYAITSALALTTGKVPRNLFEPVTWDEGNRAIMREEVLSVDLGGRMLLVPEPRSASIRAIETYVRELARAGCDVVAIDQAQNITEFVPDDRGKLAATLSALKAMARRYGVALVVVHQINRAGTDRPRLSNLKETGNFEEFSDFVVLLHDPQRAIIEEHGAFFEEHSGNYRAPKADDDVMDIYHDITPRRCLEIALAKSRSSETKRAALWFDFAEGK